MTNTSLDLASRYLDEPAILLGRADPDQRMGGH